MPWTGLALSHQANRECIGSGLFAAQGHRQLAAAFVSVGCAPFDTLKPPTSVRNPNYHMAPEAFHFRSDALIKQEIYSLLAWITVCAILERYVYRRVERSRGRQNPADPHRFQINHSNLYLVAAHLFARLLRTKDIAAALGRIR